MLSWLRRRVCERAWVLVKQNVWGGQKREVVYFVGWTATYELAEIASAGLDLLDCSLGFILRHVGYFNVLELVLFCFWITPAFDVVGGGIFLSYKDYVAFDT